MRILTLTNLYPPHHFGGYELSCSDVMNRLADRGHEIVVLTGDAHVGDVPEPSWSYPVKRELHLWWDWEAFAPSSPPATERVRGERRNQATFRRVVGEHRPDVVSVWGMGAMSLAPLAIAESAGIPLALTVQEHWLVYAHLWDPWTRVFDKRPWARPLGRGMRLVTRLPTLDQAAVNFVSAHTRDYTIRLSRWTFRDPQVIHLGIDRSDFPPEVLDDRPWSWRMLYVGRLDHNKGIATLVRAMASLPDSTALTIVGTGDPDVAEDLRRLAEDLGVRDRVEFATSSRSGLRERYRSADVLVFPSEWPEPFGLVPIEAMACGAPVVASGTGGSAEYLADGENCVTFTPADADSLVAAIQRVADSPELRRRIREGGLRTADRFTIDRYTDAMEEFLRSAH